MEKICQSCGMPMNNAEDFGTNLDGSYNEDYCVYCLNKGTFTCEQTMEEQVEENLKHLAEFNNSIGATFTEESAREEMLKFFPTLKRWRKQ